MVEEVQGEILLLFQSQWCGMNDRSVVSQSSRCGATHTRRGANAETLLDEDEFRPMHASRLHCEHDCWYRHDLVSICPLRRYALLTSSMLTNF